jgi:hypothetical protein
MCDIVLKNKLPLSIDKNKVEEQGRKVYRQNKNLRTLSNLLEHPEFSRFIEDNTKDWVDIKNIILYIKIYQAIGECVPESTSYQKLAVLKQIVDSPVLWRMVVKKYNAKNKIEI